jgi:hypothetical protein
MAIRKASAVTNERFLGTLIQAVLVRATTGSSLEARQAG